MRQGHCGVDDESRAFLQGVFQIESEHGHVHDSVTVRVAYPEGYPRLNLPPKVILVSHRDRWRPIADAHICTDWSLCLFVPLETPIDFKRHDSLNDLFAVLRTFLFKEFLFQRDLASGRLAVLPGEARSHGVTGIIEAIREKGRIGRNDACVCGSGKKFKACHGKDA